MLAAKRGLCAVPLLLPPELVALLLLLLYALKFGGWVALMYPTRIPLTGGAKQRNESSAKLTGRHGTLEGTGSLPLLLVLLLLLLLLALSLKALERAKGKGGVEAANGPLRFLEPDDCCCCCESGAGTGKGGDWPSRGTVAYTGSATSSLGYSRADASIARNPTVPGAEPMNSVRIDAT